MSLDTTLEAKRQIEICNACRYCEGYCSVFPAINIAESFDKSSVTFLANLCHNCRGCYYACQFTPPHEFAINLPGILAERRQESWHEFAWPRGFAQLFHRSGMAIALMVTVSAALIIWLINLLPELEKAEGFYRLLSHQTMILIFIPAFLLPIFALVKSTRKFWSSINGAPIKIAHIRTTLTSALTMKNLSGGHGEGCNFEDEDRFSMARTHAHHAVLIGFTLCFLSTSVATVLHYFFNSPAPYDLFSLPKLFGIPGGILLSLGSAYLAYLKTKADPDLSDRKAWGGEMAFIVLLFLVSTSGLILYVLGGTDWLPELLAFHLGCVLALFLLTPYTKMVHGIYRVAALLRDTQMNIRT
ncbi:MAG: tricarballylate utilization 4Fe-4S protein TcuB [Methyloligellaceae bacterium]